MADQVVDTLHADGASDAEASAHPIWPRTFCIAGRTRFSLHPPQALRVFPFSQHFSLYPGLPSHLRHHS
eukprot:scaffold19936_cov67-Isochrysis_galbana.AAC.1